MTRFDRFFHIMSKPLVAFAMCLFGMLSFMFLDKSISEGIHSLQLDTMLLPLAFLTHLGAGAFYMVFLLALTLFCRFVMHQDRWSRQLFFLWLCVAIPNLVCGVLKVTLGRARPELLFSSDLYGFYGFHTIAAYWSFPSGHTTTIMGLVFGLSALCPKYMWGLIGFGLPVAISRVLLLQHYFSDVVVTAYLTLIEVGVLYLFLSKKITACASK